MPASPTRRVLRQVVPRHVASPTADAPVVRRPRDLRRLGYVLLGLVSLPLAACGGGVPAASWVAAEAAVVQCSPSHPRGLPLRLFNEVPHPEIPSGLLARQLDPMALDELGYERDTPVCAILEPPPVEALDEAKSSIARLLEAWTAADSAVSAAGSCGCQTLVGDPRAAMFPSCQRRLSKCDDVEPARTALAEPLAKFDDAVTKTRLPHVHWRLVGRTDRPEWFVRNLSELLGLHDGGSVVFLRAQPLPDGFGRALVEGLFLDPEVRAVIRQDAGRAFLVVRERGALLILDHFSHGPVAPERLDLLAAIDDAQVDYVRSRLEAPAVTRRLELDPRDASFVEFDKVGLDRVDELFEVTAAMAPGGAPASSDPASDAAAQDGTATAGDDTPLRRVSFLVRRSAETRVEARVLLSDAAAEKFRSASGGGLSDFARAVTSEVRPADTAGVEPTPLPSVYRDTAVGVTWFSSMRAFFQALVDLETSLPGSVDGNPTAFSIELPSGPLPGGHAYPEGMMPLMTRLSVRRHKLEGSLDGSYLNLVLAPR